MTRLDHNRGLSILKEKYECKLEEIKGFAIQGYMGSEKFSKHIEELKKY
jgi:hypothetical protein